MGVAENGMAPTILTKIDELTTGFTYCCSPTYRLYPEPVSDSSSLLESAVAAQIHAHRQNSTKAKVCFISEDGVDQKLGAKLGICSNESANRTDSESSDQQHVFTPSHAHCQPPCI